MKSYIAINSKLVPLILALCLALVGCKKDKDDENNPLAELINPSTLTPGNFSCDKISSASACYNLKQVNQITASTLCGQLGGTVSARDVKCVNTNVLGVCTSTANDSSYLTGDQVIEQVYYTTAAGGANAYGSAGDAKTVCEDANNTMKGTWSTTYGG